MADLWNDGGQRIYVMRHGARLDSVDLQWERTTDRPYDTPITGRGKLEASQAARQRFADKVHAYYSP